MNPQIETIENIAVEFANRSYKQTIKDDLTPRTEEYCMALWQQLFREKFAELLIQECADICFNLKFTAEGPSERAEYQRSLCGMSIKENFGLVSKAPITALNVK